MKKSFLTILALALTVTLSAQTDESLKQMKEDINSSEKRVEQLHKLLDGKQIDSGVEEIDRFSSSIKP